MLDTSYWFAVNYPGLSSGSIKTSKVTVDAYSGGRYAYSNNSGASWSAGTGNDLTFAIETCLPDVEVDSSITFLPKE